MPVAIFFFFNRTGSDFKHISYKEPKHLKKGTYKEVYS